MPGGLDLSVRAKDERYVIPVTIDTAEGEVEFNLYFTPSDIHIYENLAALTNLPNIDTDNIDTMQDLSGKMHSFTSTLDINFDAIFGEGAARKTLKYTGFNMTLLKMIIGKVKLGLDHYKEQVEKAEKEQQKRERAHAKEEAAQFIANK